MKYLIVYFLLISSCMAQEFFGIVINKTNHNQLSPYVNLTNYNNSYNGTNYTLSGQTITNWQSLISYVSSLTNDLASTNWVDVYYYPRNNPSNWVTSDVTNSLPSLGGGQTWTGTNAFTDMLYATNITVSGTINGATIYPAAWGEGYIHGGSQVFTAATGFEVVTNFVGVGNTGMGSLTATSLTTIASGWYQFTGNFSFDCSAVGTEVIMHAFTNGVEVIHIGFHKSFATAGDYGNSMACGSVYMQSNDTITLRIDVDKNCTLDWDHVNCMLKKIAP